jgi:Mrp family chromosome partitioning ATPase
MDYLKQYFDYIIIDLSPVGAVTDAKILKRIAHSPLYHYKSSLKNPIIFF